jgi:hypothetical protein
VGRRTAYHYIIVSKGVGACGYGPTIAPPALERWTTVRSGRETCQCSNQVLLAIACDEDERGAKVGKKIQGRGSGLRRKESGPMT